MSDYFPPYEATMDEMARRIKALIPEHPQILTMTNPWELFHIPGFNCKDLSPSLAQTMGALKKARLEYMQMGDLNG